MAIRLYPHTSEVASADFAWVSLVIGSLQDFLNVFEVSPFVNPARKFVGHLGLTSEDPVLGTRTVAGGNLLPRSLRNLNFDISVHGPHHRYPKASPAELPERLQDYQKNHPDQPVPVFPSYTAAFLDVLTCLWNNPAISSLKQPAGHVVK